MAIISDAKIINDFISPQTTLFSNIETGTRIGEHSILYF